MWTQSRNDVGPGNALRSTPPWSVAVFLLAVFFIFASFGFVLDGMGMGRQPILRLAVSVVLIGIFSACYASTGLILRQRFWKGFVPLFLVQSICMGLLSHWLPDAPELTQLNPAQTSYIRHRLVLDSVAVMCSVTLGYIGFIIVAVAEARRRMRLQLEKTKLENELAAAREIQHVMVPEELPPTPGYAIESVYRPAAEVGGDFFQVIPLRNGETLVVVGDVSGKGLSAAMIVSMLIGILRTVSSISRDPAQILEELNARLFERTHGGFVTCLAARLEPAGRVTFANAGHLAPWLNEEEVELAGSTPLGVLAALTPEQAALEMPVGSRLTLLTDGVVEARNAQGALFGFERTQALMRQGTPPIALAEAALRHGQDDDLTVLSILRTA